MPKVIELLRDRARPQIQGCLVPNPMFPHFILFSDSD